MFEIFFHFFCINVFLLKKSNIFADDTSLVKRQKKIRPAIEIAGRIKFTWKGLSPRHIYIELHFAFGKQFAIHFAVDFYTVEQFLTLLVTI